MKNRYDYIALYFSISLLFLSGCKQKAAEQDETQGRVEQKHEKTEVKTQSARYDRFEVELVSNGKVEAKTKAVLSFGVADLVDSVFVTNGSRVKKGSPLVQVDARKSAEQLQEAELTLRKMELELRNRLMSEGITELKDTVNIPQSRLHTIMLQSGYSSAVNNYKKAQVEYEHIRVCAPFDGVVADLEVKPHNPSSLYQNVCTLIDDSQMEVVFNVLETEIAHIRRGMKVELTPYANHQITLHGEVTEVNPKIDANGMVKIKAVTTNTNHVLVDGMNVNILLKRPVENALIIPKSAVLPRQGKKVVFVHQGGKAIWKYVTTGIENSSEISIESGLQEGEEVIYDNNLGLSHESEVVVIKTK
ncbi:MAG: efflux RND transporter periplasmic adaptor subunit [Odoribacter sp.]|nr:efflux RND transporter periplasmic adaptor subunit [Odoribacter sp.]